MKKNKQPEIKKGKTFISWAVFNMNINHRTTFSTRKEAKTYCTEISGEIWNNTKKYFQIVKVKCTVI